MSTTVTYKGNTITTAENETRTLKTAGKYMEADVVVTDVTSGGGGEMVTISVDLSMGALNSVWYLPSNAVVETDPNAPWLQTITTPKESMIANGPTSLSFGINATGLTYQMVTISGRPTNYFHFFYVGTTDGTITG